MDDKWQLVNPGAQPSCLRRELQQDSSLHSEPVGLIWLELASNLCATLVHGHNCGNQTPMCPAQVKASFFQRVPAIHPDTH